MPGQHGNFSTVFQTNRTARLGRFTGTGVSQDPLRIQNALYQNLDLTACQFLTEQACRNYACIVKDHQIARLYASKQIRKLTVLNDSRHTVEAQQTTPPTSGSGFAGDQ